MFQRSVTASKPPRRDSHGTKNIWGYLTRLIGLTGYESELVDQCVFRLSLGSLYGNDSNRGKGFGRFWFEVLIVRLDEIWRFRSDPPVSIGIIRQMTQSLWDASTRTSAFVKTFIYTSSVWAEETGRGFSASRDSTPDGHFITLRRDVPL